MKKQLLSIYIGLISIFMSYTQTITFDDQGHTSGQILTNPYSITNNGETFLFTISGGTSTNHIYRTSEPSCGTTGIGHIYAGNTSQTTWEIETASGNEIDLGTIRFDNVFSCFAFNYSLTIEGFKNSISTGTQTFSVTTLNNVFTSNSSFNDVDRIVITGSDLAHLGIDDINWTALTLSNTSNDIQPVMIYPNPSSDFIKVLGVNELQTYSIYNVHGKRIRDEKRENNKIDIRNLDKGIYFLELNDQQTFRFIKQ